MQRQQPRDEFMMTLVQFQSSYLLKFHVYLSASVIRYSVAIVSRVVQFVFAARHQQRRDWSSRNIWLDSAHLLTNAVHLLSIRWRDLTRSHQPASQPVESRSQRSPPCRRPPIGHQFACLRCVSTSRVVRHDKISHFLAVSQLLSEQVDIFLSPCQSNLCINPPDINGSIECSFLSKRIRKVSLQPTQLCQF